MNNFAYLPTHIIVKILSLLRFDDFKQAAQACKTWYTASCCSTFGCQIKIHFIGDISRSYKCINRPFSRLDLTEVDRWSFKYFFKKFAFSIREIRVTRCTITLNKLARYLKYLHNLESLRIEMHQHVKFKITKRASLNLTKLCNLKVLWVECCATQCEGLSFIVNKCINLKHLTYHVNYDNCRLHYDNNRFGYTNVYTSLFDAMAQWPCVDLDSLQIIDCENNAMYFFKYFNTLNAVRVKKLKLFEISDFYYKGDFRMFCEKVHSVEELEMTTVDELDLEYICKYLHNLRFLYIKRFRGSQLDLIRGLKQLQILIVIKLITFYDAIELAVPNISNIKHKKLTQVLMPRKLNTLVEHPFITKFLMLQLHLNVKNDFNL